jgi:hypothetical protein
MCRWHPDGGVEYPVECHREICDWGLISQNLTLQGWSSVLNGVAFVAATAVSTCFHKSRGRGDVLPST